MTSIRTRRGSTALPRFAVILGTNEIASAIAVRLAGEGFGVVMSHDPDPPVIRRRMAFHDALFQDPVSLNGISAVRADTVLEVRDALFRGGAVVVTALGLLDLMVLRTLDVLIDARLQKYVVTPDLRRLARRTIGLGPGFAAGANCDVAIETRPRQEGEIITSGPTAEADGTPRRLGRSGAERLVYAPVPGLWHTAIEIGTRVFKDYIVGRLADQAMRAIRWRPARHRPRRHRSYAGLQAPRD